MINSVNRPSSSRSDEVLCSIGQSSQDMPVFNHPLSKSIQIGFNSSSRQNQNQYSLIHQVIQPYKATPYPMLNSHMSTYHRKLMQNNNLKDKGKKLLLFSQDDKQNIPSNYPNIQQQYKFGKVTSSNQVGQQQSLIYKLKIPQSSAQFVKSSFKNQLANSISNQISADQYQTKFLNTSFDFKKKQVQYEGSQINGSIQSNEQHMTQEQQIYSQRDKYSIQNDHIQNLNYPLPQRNLDPDQQNFYESLTPHQVSERKQHEYQFVQPPSNNKQLYRHQNTPSNHYYSPSNHQYSNEAYSNRNSSSKKLDDYNILFSKKRPFSNNESQSGGKVYQMSQRPQIQNEDNQISQQQRSNKQNNSQSKKFLSNNSVSKNSKSLSYQLPIQSFHQVKQQEIIDDGSISSVLSINHNNNMIQQVQLMYTQQNQTNNQFNDSQEGIKVLSELKSGLSSNLKSGLSSNQNQSLNSKFYTGTKDKNKKQNFKIKKYDSLENQLEIILSYKGQIDDNKSGSRISSNKSPSKLTDNKSEQKTSQKKKDIILIQDVRSIEQSKQYRPQNQDYHHQLEQQNYNKPLTGQQRIIANPPTYQQLCYNQNQQALRFKETKLKLLSKPYYQYYHLKYDSPNNLNFANIDQNVTNFNLQPNFYDTHNGNQNNLQIQKQVNNIQNQLYQQNYQVTHGNLNKHQQGQNKLQSLDQFTNQEKVQNPLEQLKGQNIQNSDQQDISASFQQSKRSSSSYSDHEQNLLQTKDFFNESNESNQTEKGDQPIREPFQYNAEKFIQQNSIDGQRNTHPTQQNNVQKDLSYYLNKHQSQTKTLFDKSNYVQKNNIYPTQQKRINNLTDQKPINLQEYKTSQIELKKTNPCKQLGLKIKQLNDNISILYQKFNNASPILNSNQIPAKNLQTFPNIMNPSTNQQLEAIDMVTSNTKPMDINIQGIQSDSNNQLQKIEQSPDSKYSYKQSSSNKLSQNSNNQSAIFDTNKNSPNHLQISTTKQNTQKQTEYKKIQTQDKIKATQSQQKPKLIYNDSKIILNFDKNNSAQIKFQLDSQFSNLLKMQPLRVQQSNQITQDKPHYQNSKVQIVIQQPAKAYGHNQFQYNVPKTHSKSKKYHQSPNSSNKIQSSLKEKSIYKSNQKSNVNQSHYRSELKLTNQKFYKSLAQEEQPIHPKSSTKKSSLKKSLKSLRLQYQYNDDDSSQCQPQKNIKDSHSSMNDYCEINSRKNVQNHYDQKSSSNCSNNYLKDSNLSSGSNFVINQLTDKLNSQFNKIFHRI